jgi:hypothetical protein
MEIDLNIFKKLIAYQTLSHKSISNKMKKQFYSLKISIYSNSTQDINKEYKLYTRKVQFS